MLLQTTWDGKFLDAVDIFFGNARTYSSIYCPTVFLSYATHRLRNACFVCHDGGPERRTVPQLEEGSPTTLSTGTEIGGGSPVIVVTPVFVCSLVRKIKRTQPCGSSKLKVDEVVVVTIYPSSSLDFLFLRLSSIIKFPRPNLPR